MQVLLETLLHHVAGRILIGLVQRNAFGGGGDLARPGPREPVVLQLRIVDRLEGGVGRNDPVVVLVEADGHRHVQLRRHRGVEVRSEVQLLLRDRAQPFAAYRNLGIGEALLLILGHLNGAVLIVQVGRHKKPDGFSAAARAHAIRVARAVVDDGTLRIAQQQIAGQTVGDARCSTLCRRRRHERQLASDRRGRSRRMAPVHEHRGITVAILDASTLAIESPARRAGTALLRRDDDHAVGGAGAVQRRRRWALHDLDILNVVRVESVEQRERCPGARVGGTGVIAHSIHHINRSVRKTDGGRAPNANRGCTTQHRSREHDNAGRLGDHQVGQAADLRLLDLLRDVAERRNGIADLQPALLPRCRRDDFLELHDSSDQDEIGSDGGAIGDHNRLLLGLIADMQGFDTHRAGGHIAQRVLAVIASDRDDVAADDDRPRLAERRSGRDSRDRAAYSALRLQ